MENAVKSQIYLLKNPGFKCVWKGVCVCVCVCVCLAHLSDPMTPYLSEVYVKHVKFDVRNKKIPFWKHTEAELGSTQLLNIYIMTDETMASP